MKSPYKERQKGVKGHPNSRSMGVTIAETIVCEIAEEEKTWSEGVKD